MNHTPSYDLNINISSTVLVELFQQGIALIHSISKDTKFMSQELLDLQDEVTKVHGTVESAISLIQGIAARIDAASQSADAPAALQALSDSLRADDDALAAAVVSGSPAAPTGPTGPVVDPNAPADPVVPTP